MRRRAVLSGAHLRGFANASRPAALAVAIPSRVPRAFVARRCFRPTRSIQVHDVVRVARASRRPRSGRDARSRAPPGRRGPASRRVAAARWRARASEAPADADVVRAPRPEYIPSRIDDENYVRVFDTTLRDGEQSPGATARARTDRRPRPQTPSGPSWLRRAAKGVPNRSPSRALSRPPPRPTDAPRPTEFTSRAPARRVSHRLERRVEAAVPLLPSLTPPPPFSTRPLVRPPPRTASSSRVRFPNRESRQARR